MKTLLICVALLWASSPVAAGQRASCTQNTGNNASVFLDKASFRALAGSVLRAYGNAGCVGESRLLASATGDAYPLTVWGDDEITSTVLDGLAPNEPIRLALEKPATTVMLDTNAPFASRFEYASDRLYFVTAAEFDTTTTRLLNELAAETAALAFTLDSLRAADSTTIASLTASVAALQDERDNLLVANESLADEIESLETTLASANASIAALTSERDALVAERDSLQAVVDSFPDDAAQRIADLERTIVEVNAALAQQLAIVRDIRRVASRPGNKFQEICAIVGCVQ